MIKIYFSCRSGIQCPSLKFPTHQLPKEKELTKSCSLRKLSLNSKIPVKSKKADAQVTFYSRGSNVIVMFKQLSQFQMSKLFILNAMADVLSVIATAWYKDTSFPLRYYMWFSICFMPPFVKIRILAYWKHQSKWKKYHTVQQTFQNERRKKEVAKELPLGNLFHDSCLPFEETRSKIKKQCF